MKYSILIFGLYIGITVFLHAQQTSSSECFLLSENIVYPSGLEAVIDVTQAPYNADPTGEMDCTAALIRAIDDVLRPDYEALKKTWLTIQNSPDLVFWYKKLPFAERQEFMRDHPLAVVGQERVHGIFPYRSSPSRILYFPNGTYLVSDTLTYSFGDLKNQQGLELCWRLHFRGQSRTGAVIRLKEHSAGFESGADKPVVSFIHSGRSSNVAMQNSFENLTIEIGAGNPGASGLNFFSNNSGAVRHVTVRSDDSYRTGTAGVEIKEKNSTSTLISDVAVTGFDYGIKIDNASVCNNAVIEHAVLSGQGTAGLSVNGRNASVRRLVSHNSVPAVQIKGEATLALLDSDFTGIDAANNFPAVDFQGGYLFARNIKTSGYGQAIIARGQLKAVPGKIIKDYVSHSWLASFTNSAPPASLPVEETPVVSWPKPEDWVSVNSFGAKGDGFTDDTDAIQAAMNSGRPAVYFEPGIYLIDKKIMVPSSVQRVNFMYSDLISGGHLLEQTKGAAFCVVGENKAPLLIEDLFAFELFYGPRLLEHASSRTLILSDLHTQSARMYFNSVTGGKVFIENCASAVPVDDLLPDNFSFKGQQVWARQLDPERALPLVSNENSKLWVLGFRTEPRNRPGFQTTGGGITELLGGHFSHHGSGTPAPKIINHNSAVTVFGAAVALSPSEDRNTYMIVSETRGKGTGGVTWNRFPVFQGKQAVVFYAADLCDTDKRLEAQ